MQDHERPIKDIIEKHKEEKNREAAHDAETFRFIGLAIIAASLVMILFYINGINN